MTANTTSIVSPLGSTDGTRSLTTKSPVSMSAMVASPLCQGEQHGTHNLSCLGMKSASPTFEFKIMIELAENLALQELNKSSMSAQAQSTSSANIDYLIKLCPIMTSLNNGKMKSPSHSTNSEADSNNNKDLDSDDIMTDYASESKQQQQPVLLSETRQVAALALGYYSVISKGAHLDRILPCLLSLLKYLPFCKWHSKSAITPDFFTRHFINVLHDISTVVPSTSEEICKVMIDDCMIQCQNIMKTHVDKFLYESRNTTRVLYGIMKGLSDGLLNFEPNQIRVIVDVIQQFMIITTSIQKNEQAQQMKAFKSRLLKSMMVFVVKILYRITVLNRGMVEDDYDRFLSIALKNISVNYIQRTLSAKKGAGTGSAVKLFIHSVELATQIAVVRKQFRHTVFLELSNILQAVHEYGQTSDEEKVYEPVVQAISTLSIEDSSLTTAGVKTLREFAENIVDKSERIKNMPINALCSILKNDYLKNSLSNISSVVYAISNSIYMEKEVEKNNMRIIIFGEIALQLNQPSVTELIRPVLMGQFARKKLEGTTDVITTGQLAKIAHLGDEKSFEEVVDIIFGIHQNPLHSTDTSLGMVLTNSIYIILDNLTNPKLKATLLMRTIKLFIKIASEIQSDSANKTRQREFGQHIGILLPVIAKQLRSLNANPTECSPDIQKLVRTMWFYCVLFDFFNYKEQWKFEFTDACQDIAMYAPVLTSHSKKSYSFLEIEKELNVLIDKSRLVLPLIEYQNQLYAVVANNQGHSDLTTVPQAFIKKFDMARTIYLLSVYYLETLRAKSGTFRYSLQYLGDHGLAGNPEFFKCLVSVTDKSFLKWKDFVTSREQDTTNMIELEVIFLLKSFCSRSDAIRKSSMVFISIMTKAFPHVFWSYRCIKTLLDLLSALYERSDIGRTTDIVSIQIPLEDSNEMDTLYLPENFSAREKMLERFQKLALDWIKVALTYFPNIVKSHLEEYLLKFSRSLNGQLQHIGYSLAVYMTMPTEYLQKMNSQVLVKDRRKGLSTLSEGRFYAMTQSVSVQSYHNGEIDALRKIAAFENRDLEQLFMNNLSECIRDKSNLDITKFNHYMQLATAFIVGEQALKIKLLQWIVWTPVFLMKKDTMDTAVFCWRWVSSYRPEFELVLLTEIAHAWSWTINQRLGLFNSVANEGAIELAVEIPDVEESLDDTKPHRIWINYLAERFQVMSNAGKDIISVFFKILMSSFEDPTILSTNHNSLGTRFRLCLLGIIVAKHAEPFDLPISMLRDRTYSAILNWFTLHPTWYDPGSVMTVEEDCRVLKELNRKLSLEFTSASASRSNGFDLNLYSDSKSGYSERRSTIFGSGSGSSKARSTTGTTKTTTSNGTYSSKASNLISLIVLLISHEIERMIIWHEPQNADEAIAHANADNSIVTQKIIDPRTWKMYIDTAWSFSPKLALRLPIRFPLDIIRIELQKYVKDCAATLVDIPDAVTYLVTPFNVENKIDELKYLLNWAPATLSVALTFLNVPYVQSPLVAQFAIRTLRKFSPEAVVFYLPQLVQCLRHDHRGILKRFLLNISKRSVMFAHQLIWTLRTEIIPNDYEETEHLKPADIEISSLCQLLNDEVFKILDVRQLALYEEEFGFFDQLNKISGDLIPVEKELRTGRLQEAMALISTSANLYPPTDTKYQILNFEPKGCITLKSAKKVPILVPFVVKERPRGLDIGQELSEKEKQIYALTQPQVRNLIFKMGDDCRQDQLALQIISMFKQVFKRLELPLYLYPYRVITTGRDMGIIECVPNSKSRHDLGGVTEGDLYDYFIKKYGHENTIEFQRARKNFIESMAAYSVVSYILNIKDRHNGNLLVDEDGHLIHIDFGFIFDIAPGGNYGIEVRVPFKLTYEMLLLMGENVSKEKQQQAKQQSMIPTHNVTLSMDPNTNGVGYDEPIQAQDHAEPFNLFVDLVVRGFLASRDHMDSIVSIVEVMLQSELPCFKQDAIKNLKARFCADKPEKEAARFIREKVTASYQNIWSVVYDKYQQKFEGVMC